jgi:DNA polymerase (family X)
MSVHNYGMLAAGQDPYQRRVLLDEAVTVAASILAWLRDQPGCTAASEVGALRRRHERFDRIALLAAATTTATLIGDFCASPIVGRVLRRSATRVSVLTGDGVHVTVTVVAPVRFVAALQRLTGSAAHNRALPQRAGHRPPGHDRPATEDALYAALGYAPIPPELREGRGELEAAHRNALPALVDVSLIRGDLHTHTTASDGEASIDEMAHAALARGYQYLAITEHSPNVDQIVDRPIGLDVGRLREHVAAIRECAGTLAGAGLTLLAGAEVDILPDGSLDYPDEVLAQLDWVVASPHVALRQSAARATARMVAAASHPLVDVIGHPTGRHLLERAPSAADPHRLVAACAEHGTFLEINANPERLDLSARNARLALDAGVPLVISTDAHAVSTLGNMQFGVVTARRAWATAADIVNTRSWSQLQQLRKCDRRR